LIKQNNDQTTALVALVQSANLVERLACSGHVPESAFEIMCASLFKFDVNETHEIYVNETENDLTQNLYTGLRVAKKIFVDDESQEYAHTVRYVLALIQLEKHFRKATKMQEKVGEALAAMPEDVEDSQLSDLYLETLATLPFRIQVLGKMQHLQNTINEHKVRVLLFAGLRAAMLWRQKGGRRWHFLLKKRAIANSLEQFTA
jgi:high frequency lysogenization protein